MTTSETSFEKHNPKVSIIIPVYKVRKYIEECINSVINQTYRNIQLILVDDAGNDGSIELAESILKKKDIEWVIIRHEKNRGLSAARNTGVEHATGDYIYFLDSDDYISTDCIDNLLYAAMRDNSDIVYGRYATVRDGIIEVCKFSNYNKYEFFDNALELYFNHKIYTMACNLLINNKFYKHSRISFMEEILHEDELWSFHIVSFARRICYSDKITYFYRRNIICTMSDPKLIYHRLHSSCIILNEHFNIAKSFGINNCVLFHNWFSTNIINLCYNIVRSRLSRKEKNHLLDCIFSNTPITTELFHHKKFFYLFRKLFSFLPGYSWLSFMFFTRNLCRVITQRGKNNE